MVSLMNYFTGPRLYSVPSGNVNQWNNYVPNVFESIPQFTMSSTKLLYGIFKWTVIIWMPIIYKKYKTTEQITSTGRLMMYFAVGYWILYVVRGFGRMINPVYSDFMVILQKAQLSPSSENMEMLSKFHFDFSHWPVQFDASLNKNSKTSPKVIKTRGMNIPTVFKPICYILAHTIGIRMTFPGCTSLFNSIVAGQRRDRLLNLMKEKNVKRVKIKTADNNEIEAFYGDNRMLSDPNGKTVVICCEGNTGYPELGNPKIPLEKNYSVIGWNHPGFGGSTGKPFPSSEQLAIDAVVQFAKEYLNFEDKNIILFGWSIGGYTATWAAMNYPNIKGLVLDATFDNIDKLAEKSMPLILYPLVISTVREYIDLNVGSQLAEYRGPVSFIIRAQDEIITVENGEKSTNRGYNLVEELLKKRYPGLISDKSLGALWMYLASSKIDARIILERQVDRKFCESTLVKALNTSGSNLYPFQLTSASNLTHDEKSQILIYLASRYVDEFESSHCTELPARFFNEGWSEHHLAPNNHSKSYML